MDSVANAGPGEAASRPKILFVIGQLNVGGTENHLAMVAPALVRKGWRVSVFSLQGPGPVGETLAAGGVEVIRPPQEPAARPAGGVLRSFRFVLSVFRLANVLIRTKPSIVHFFLPAAYLVGAPLAALAGTPIRVMSRRSLNAYQAAYPFVSAVEKKLHRGMTAVLGNSLSVVRELRDQEGVPASKLGLIYNGLDTSHFAQAEPPDQARAALGLSPHDLVMVTVANLIPYKGHADLLAALGRAQPGLPPNWRLLVVGRDDGIGPELKRLCAELGLGEHVDFLGARNDIPRLLAAADAGLLCSHEEGFSNALLEGMAAGLPMIVTDVGGNAEAVIDQENGLIVPAKDPARLAEAILCLANDPPLRARFGAAARTRVAQYFSLERCVDGYDALYRALLAGRPVSDVEQLRIAAR